MVDDLDWCAATLADPTRSAAGLLPLVASEAMEAVAMRSDDSLQTHRLFATPTPTR